MAKQNNQAAELAIPPTPLELVKNLHIEVSISQEGFAVVDPANGGVANFWIRFGTSADAPEGINPEQIVREVRKQLSTMIIDAADAHKGMAEEAAQLNLDFYEYGDATEVVVAERSDPEW